MGHLNKVPDIEFLFWGLYNKSNTVRLSCLCLECPKIMFRGIIYLWLNDPVNTFW